MISKFFFIYFLSFQLASCEAVQTFQELTIHLTNVAFLYILIYITFFLYNNKSFFFSEKFKLWLIFLIITFSSKIVNCASSNSKSKINTFTKKKFILKTKKKVLFKKKNYLFFLKKLNDLKVFQKFSKRLKICERTKGKYYKNDRYVASFWDALIAKWTFKPSTLLKKELPFLKKKINSKNNLLQKLYIEFDINFRNKLKFKSNLIFKEMEKYLNEVFSKIDNKSSHFSDIIILNKDVFKIIKYNPIKLQSFNKIFKKKINTLNFYTQSIKLRIKNIKFLLEDGNKKPRYFSYHWWRDFIFKENQIFTIKKDYGQRLINKLFWIPKEPWSMHTQIKTKILESIQTFYYMFTCYFASELSSFHFFYSDNRYQIISIFVFLGVMYKYNRKFYHLINDNLIINVKYREMDLLDVGAYSYILYVVLVYLWYFTMTPDVTIKMIYATALMAIITTLLTYYRYYKVAPKYK
jgi:hypothetical protein